jgi:hypothetical protein
MMRRQSPGVNGADSDPLGRQDCRGYPAERLANGRPCRPCPAPGAVPCVPLASWRPVSLDMSTAARKIEDRHIASWG